MSNQILAEPIFSTIINTAQLDKSLIEKLNKHISKLKHSDFSNTNQTNNTFILDLNNLIDIKFALESIINLISKEIYNVDIKTNQVYITQSWINKNDPGVGHDRHMHPNSFLSGIIFLSESSVAPTFFSIVNRMLFGHTTPNMDIVDKWTPNVEMGKLLIFPSGLEHEVPKNIENQTRYTLSFNTSVSGPYGRVEELTYRG